MNPLFQLPGTPGTTQLPAISGPDTAAFALSLPAEGPAKDTRFATALDAARAMLGPRDPEQEWDSGAPSELLPTALPVPAAPLVQAVPDSAAVSGEPSGGKVSPLAAMESGSGLPPGQVAPAMPGGTAAGAVVPAGAGSAVDVGPSARVDAYMPGSSQTGPLTGVSAAPAATAAASGVPELAAREPEPDPRSAGPRGAEPKADASRGSAAPLPLAETLRALSAAEGAVDAKVDPQSQRAPAAEAAGVAALLERRGRVELAAPPMVSGPPLRSGPGEVGSASADVPSADQAGTTPPAGSDGVDAPARAAVARAGAGVLQPRDLGALAERVEMLMHRRADAASLKMSLGDLGELEISVRMESRQAHVHFAVHDPQLRESLEAQLPRLRDLLEQGGLDLGDIGMNSPPDSGGDPGPRDGSPARRVEPAAEGDVGALAGPDERQWRSGDHLIDAFV